MFYILAKKDKEKLIGKVWADLLGYQTRGDVSLDIYSKVHLVFSDMKVWKMHKIQPHRSFLYAE